MVSLNMAVTFVAFSLILGLTLTHGFAEGLDKRFIFRVARPDGTLEMKYFGPATHHSINWLVNKIPRQTVSKV